MTFHDSQNIKISYGQANSFMDYRQPSRPESTDNDSKLPANPNYSSKHTPFPNFSNGPVPVNEAVTNALTQSDATSHIDPILVAQITEQVINSLRASKVSTYATAQTSQLPFPPTQVYPDLPPGSLSSSTTSADISIPDRTVHTPPSHATCNSRTGVPPLLKTFLNSSMSSTLHSNSSIRENGRSAPVTIPKVHNVVQQRPRRNSELSDLDEETPVERIWQPLFDSQCRPTKRLGQFLRGLANHIVRINMFLPPYFRVKKVANRLSQIEEFEPCQSIVITPKKLLNFYKAVPVPDDIYPWHGIYSSSIQ